MVMANATIMTKGNFACQAKVLNTRLILGKMHHMDIKCITESKR